MENRNLQWNKRVKVPLILIFSVNTNHESVAYRSFSPSKFEARGARKVTTGMNLCRSVVPGKDLRGRSPSVETGVAPGSGDIESDNPGTTNSLASKRSEGCRSPVK